MNEPVVIAQYCADNLDFENHKLSQSYYYNHVTLAVIDSIFSIGVKYQSVLNTVNSFCESTMIEERTYLPDQEPIQNEDQYTPSQFIENFESGLVSSWQMIYLGTDNALLQVTDT